MISRRLLPLNSLVVRKALSSPVSGQVASLERLAKSLEGAFTVVDWYFEFLTH